MSDQTAIKAGLDCGDRLAAELANRLDLALERARTLLSELKALKTLIDRADILEGHRRKCLIWKGQDCDCRVGIAMVRVSRLIYKIEQRSTSGEQT